MLALFEKFRKGRFSHGIHPRYHKDATRGKAIQRLAFPPRLIVPVAQHIGAPAKPVVNVGQEVLRGQIIAEADGFMSVPVHAPATGVVSSIGLMPSAAGPKVLSIVIDVYKASSQYVLYGNPVEPETLDHDELIQRVQATGMAGLGGAAFPSHVKLRIPHGKTAHTLVVNGCECEPYLTCDHRVMLEQPQDLLQGIRYALHITGAKRAIVGIEDNKADAAAAIKAALKPDDPITVELVETKYPQGAEKMLLKSLLGVEVPAGGLPIDIGIVVNNVGTLAQLGKLLPKGEGLIERVVTVTGTNVAKAGNYLMPIGTPVRFILEQLGITADHEKVILGGPMMGMSLPSLDVPITKGTSGLLVFQERTFLEGENDTAVFPCIKCSRCVDACPMHLNPAQMGWLAGKRHYAEMESDFHLNSCFECGCCSFVCPSNIPLVQYFRIAKAVNREQKGKA
ncbi:electron transport complex subunit RsxC [Thiothrix unzii]|jgi:electron transport complex protein RnfC|uniref:electron transport complex subunit RsxC n=1 Tax=Thiothrix unzii TaxID=111769 RepID=UPI002A35DE31|nr:electron transport complex subunit RsxC [Thiothrix unzii]MDX9990000.1 electron transport complex subunit RsxC [Thiothrix unzii]